ncbi:Nucleotidyltransferase domain-containing protein [Dyadobacter soli]|uniref:Nucleotidyltransferase domain-containing protein n=1 Tax=Dyadobacter soli TaxID=659014 RepID=A0A1G8C0E0_9BACT|nr:nucleotidyltransferase domain-containing protein [Dyadobacter soli]SDH38834.1 Nucleotidyltransferase domain-containing protein [Dyadobacter soli]
MNSRKVPESIAGLAEEFAKGIRALYGDRLDRVILFGSYARGEQHEESDVDFLVVLEGIEINGYHEIGLMSPFTFEMSIKYGLSVSAVPMSAGKFEGNCSLLSNNIHTDGILLWKKHRSKVSLKKH